MSGQALNVKLLSGCVLAFIVAAANAQVPSGPPRFDANGWLNQGTFMGGSLIPAPGTPPEFFFHQRADYPFVPNGAGRQPTYRVADLDANPNVKPWAKDVMKKDNDEVIKGKIAYTARQACKPAGLPGFDMYGFQPVFFVQTPKKVTMLFAGDQQVRHVYMDVPHSANVKPSWYGESVGHYEGDTLVIDTIGLNTKTFIDNYRTPHSDKLHVVERWRIVEADSILEVRVTIDDPETYNKPWSALQRFRRVPTAFDEEICQEGNLLLFDYGVPKDDKPDF